MTTSTDGRRPSGPPRRCPHEGAYAPELLEQLHHDCPADLSLWCAARILSQARELEAECQVRGWDYYEKLHSQFRAIIEESLLTCFGDVEVFWATREKPNIDEMPHAPRKGTRPGSMVVNEIIFDLNRNYHAHKLLSALAQFGVGRSHIFTIGRMPDGVRLTCHPMVTKDGSHRPVAAWEINVSLTGTCSVAQLCEHLCAIAEANGPDARQKIADEIRMQIDLGAADAVWPEQDFRNRLESPTERDLADKMDHEALTHPDRGFARLYVEAVKHMALIALYEENNDFAAMTYLLAPTLHGESESSLVVYWPRLQGEGPLHLLYLLQMILGQNATAILAKDLEIQDAHRLAEARKMALGHLGHTLKHRLDTVQAFLDQHGQAGLSGHVRMLADLTVILELNMVDDREELLALEKRKRDRFLEYADEGSAQPLNLLDCIMQDWPKLVAREQSYSDEGKRLDAWCRLDMHSRIRSAQIGHALVDADGRRCCLSEAVYRELLFELLLNVRRYGYVQRSLGETHNGTPVVSVRCDLGAAEIGGRTLLTLLNQVHPGKDLPSYLRSADWSRWPAERKYDGPGMALELLRRLKMGDLFFRCQTLDTGEVLFSVGMDLLGLEIT